MADSSDMNSDDISQTSNLSGDNQQTENANNKPCAMKRNRDTMITSSADDSEDSEPNEKRPAFRLQPPTLIHGQAKPVPKQEENKVNNTASRCKFLQPPKLSAPSSSTATISATSASAIQLESEPLVSSSNPFLMMAGKAPNDEPKEAEPSEESEQGELFASNSTNEVKVNGNGPSDETQPDSTTGVETTSKTDNKSENLFLQAATSSNANQDTATSSGFVFGSKMEDRVTISNDTKSPGKDSGDGAPSSSGFVFGQNLSERAKVTSSTDSAPSLFNIGNTSADSTISPGDSTLDESANSPSSSSNPERKHSHGLKEDAAAHFFASQNKPVIPEVEVVTGEEDEKNVLQMQCKLHQFDASTQNWLERAVGSLHLNDGKLSDNDVNFQSRLVMRAHGSFRLVLNTKIWAQMTVERASKKSVRVTAQTDDGSIGVFLITGNINDTEQIFRALEYRILHQKQLEEKRKALKKEDPTSSEVLDSSENANENNDTKSGETDADEQRHTSDIANAEEKSSVGSSEQPQNDNSEATNATSESTDERDTKLNESETGETQAADTPS